LEAQCTLERKQNTSIISPQANRQRESSSCASAGKGAALRIECDYSRPQSRLSLLAGGALKRGEVGSGDT